MVDPEALNAWRDIFRDFTIIALAAFSTIFGVIVIHDPTLLGIVLGFAATLLGVPAAVRLDAARRRSESRAADTTTVRHDESSHG